MTDKPNTEHGNGTNTLLAAVPPAPNGGCFGDPDFYNAYIDLIKALGELIPKDRSHGALSLKGTGAMARAKCKAVVAKARVMEEMMKAVTYGR